MKIYDMNGLSAGLCIATRFTAGAVFDLSGHRATY